MSVLEAFIDRSQHLEQRSRALARSSDVEKLWRKSTNESLVEFFHEVCQLSDATGLMECGAHAAETSRHFVEGRVDRTAVAVEANPYTYRSKTYSASTLGVRVVNAGVAAESGRLNLRIPNEPLSLSPTPGNASFLERTISESNYEEVEVDVTTVDSLVSEYLFDRPFALWIDVEGQNRQVLAGAELSLKSSKCRAVFIEVESHSYWRDQALADEVVDSLLQVGMVPIARDAERPRQYNVVFTREDLVASLEPRILAYWESATHSSVESHLRFWVRALWNHSYGGRLPRTLTRRLIGDRRYLQLWEQWHGRRS